MLKYWIWLATCEGLSRKSAVRIVEHFGSPKAAMFADEEEYALVPGLRQAERETLRQKDLSRAERILDDCMQKGIQVLTYADAAYPERLRQLEDAPLVLYWTGRLPAFDSLPVIGVVGTRNATAYGLKIARRLGYQIGQAGGVVVSGMAKGIDALATEGCLGAGQTAVGVLGCGVDVVYPWDNRSLFKDMQQLGCLLSEYAPGTEPKGEHFPIRNRIISGLGLGVLVVEAPERSGSLITARLALEQGRDVYAVPGPIDTDAFAGSNGLIQQGAMLVTCGWDVLAGYAHRFGARLKKPEGGIVMDLTQKDLRQSKNPAQTDNSTEYTAEKKSGKSEENGENAAEKGIDSPQNKPYSDLESVIAELSADERSIVYHLLEGPMQADELVVRTGLTAAKVMAAMTMLQVRGLAEQRAGKILALCRSGFNN